MAAKQIIEKDGIIFNIFEKSIKIENVPDIVFFGRPVSEEDISPLLTLINYGKYLKKRELSDKFSSIFKELGIK